MGLVPLSPEKEYNNYPQTFERPGAQGSEVRVHTLLGPQILETLGFRLQNLELMHANQHLSTLDQYWWAIQTSYC